MKTRSLFYLVTLVSLFGCSISELTSPPVANDTNLVNTIPLPFTGGATINSMEGIYKLTSGSEDLGTRFVCKVSKYKVSFFSNSNGLFIILKYGYKASDGSIQFSGFWRYSESKTQGNIQFSISAADGSAGLLAGVVTNLKLQGSFEGKLATLQYEKDFSTNAKNNPIMIFAHHGVQTYSDPPFMENSHDVVLYGGDYGVNGLELDVRLTKDNVPILIHDPTINIRLTQKGPLFGYWDQYGFDFITNYVKLLDGQHVPSVEQALKTFVDSTSLKYVWLDMKGNDNVFKYLEPVVRNAYTRAAATPGRGPIQIFAGLPSSAVIDELNEEPTYKKGDPTHPTYPAPLPTLAEESLDKALATGSQYFGPRYTVGLLLDDVQKAHDNGIKVISWTLNSKAIISNYLANGNFDGFITDYPAYIIYEFYTTK